MDKQEAANGDGGVDNEKGSQQECQQSDRQAEQEEELFGSDFPSLIGRAVTGQHAEKRCEKEAEISRLQQPRR